MVSAASRAFEHGVGNVVVAVLPVSSDAVKISEAFGIRLKLFYAFAALRSGISRPQTSCTQAQ